MWHLFVKLLTGEGGLRGAFRACSFPRMFRWPACLAYALAVAELQPVFCLAYHHGLRCFERCLPFRRVVTKSGEIGPHASSYIACDGARTAFLLSFAVLYQILTKFEHSHDFEWKREECYILRKPDPAVLVAVTKEPPGKIQTRAVQILDYNLNRYVRRAFLHASLSIISNCQL